MSSFAWALENIQKNESSTRSFTSDAKTGLTHNELVALAEALKTNTTVVDLNLSRSGVSTNNAIEFAEAFKVNRTLTRVDLSYNRIGSDGLIAIAEALATHNSTIRELKIGEQSQRAGTAAEAAFGKLFDTNITLTTLSLQFDQSVSLFLATKGEVRNREIAKRIERGESYMDLDPSKQAEFAELKRKERIEQKEKEAAESVVITEKIPSTGGPYTLKQLTCNKQFLPDDVDQSKRETYLSDEEFSAVFAMPRSQFQALPTWKKATLRKNKGLF